MAILFGRNTFLKLAPESSYGVTGSYKTNAVRVIDVSLQTTQQRDRSNHLSSSDGAIAQSTFDQFRESGGSLTVPLYYEGSTLLLKALIGNITTTSSGSDYVHRLKSNTTSLDSFTVALQRGSDTTGGQEVFTGCMINSGTISITAGEEASLSLDIIAKDSAARASGLTPTYNTTQKRVQHYETSVDLTFNGQTYKVRSFEMTIENSLERRNVLGSKLTESPDVTDFRSVVVSVELDAQNNNLYNAMLAGTESSLVIKFDETGSTNYMEFTLNNSIITDYSDPISTVGRLSQSVTFTALAGASTEALKLEIQNTLDGANALNT